VKEKKSIFENILWLNLFLAYKSDNTFLVSILTIMTGTILKGVTTDRLHWIKKAKDLIQMKVEKKKRYKGMNGTSIFLIKAPKLVRDIKNFRSCERFVQSAEAFRICEKWQNSAEAYASGKSIVVLSLSVNVKEKYSFVKNETYYVHGTFKAGQILSQLNLLEEAASYFNDAAKMMERISLPDAQKYYGKCAE